MDPERDVGAVVGRGQGEHLRREKGAVVVVQLAVEYHDPPPIQVLAVVAGEVLGFIGFRHGTSVRRRTVPVHADLPAADPPTADPAPATVGTQGETA
ncbi:hypothetical protein GCM10009855_35670 [Gordonia cholesterolivorans]|uniref:Uncharacterized protein n=1 Tax=Gordonia cholesterolivorans TaxID=559625 RepID=A0ABP5V406_9ACTN